MTTTPASSTLASRLFSGRVFRPLLALLGLALAPLALGQGTVTSGISGLIRDTTGKPVAGATITATHTPTGTTYTAVSAGTGHYNFRGLIVGGPYTLAASASGFKSTEKTDITTSLGQDIDVNLPLEKSDVVVMEKFTVKTDSNELDANASGAGTLLNSQRLGAKPTTQRSLADLVSASSFVTLHSLSSANDREEAHIVALGQNNRYNSVLIDGAKINDQFGLNGTGLASFFNPLSIDIIDQLAIDVSPYDVRQSGFTGAAINAVTKSGTNTFHGSIYYDLSKDKLLGNHGQGPDVAPGGTQNTIPILKRETKGFTFGGPLIKNKLFFFVNYEKFLRIAPPALAGMTPAAADVAAVSARFAAIATAVGKGTNFGTIGQSVVNQADDKKKLAKLDWNIITGQRLSLRYSETNGQVPQFGSYNTTSFGAGVGTLVGGASTSYSSNFYAQLRKEKAYTATLLSQWTANFKTEIRYADTKQDQYTPNAATLPQIRIFGVTGINQSGATITNGVLVAGTDQFRMGNQINVHTKSYSATGDYFLGGLTLSGGFDREKNDDYNLFRAGSYGIVDFASITDFQNDNINAFSRAFYVQGTPVADVSESAITGIFGQAKWDATPLLSVTGGVRYDYVESDTKPPFNQLFQDRFGVRNDGTVDGTNSLSPRLSFNWATNDTRTTQVRGGVGHFLGRAPWVFFSNSYSAPGIGRYSLVTNPTTGLVNYLQTSFDPANPIGSSASIPAGGRYEIDYTDKNIEIPSVWRGNLALDHKLPFWNSTFSIEGVQTKNDKELFITNDNLLPTTVGADGRQRFAGNPGGTNLALAKNPEFLNVYHVRNVSTGMSRYISFTWDRPMKAGWAANLSYTRGRSTDAQSFGQTTASGQWNSNVVFNQNKVEEAHSDFEVPERVQATFTREFAFAPEWKTTVSLYYEGHTGNPYSYVYNTDLNGDSRADNDLIAVPTDANDARFDFSVMTPADQAAYFAYLQKSGLSKFAGGVARRNAFYQPWVSRLDLHFAQEIPVYKPFQLELFLDFINFGSFLNHQIFNYFEKAPLNANDTFWRLQAGGASYAADGRIRPTFSAAAAPTNGAFLIDNVQSRWRIQVGAKLKF